MTMKQIMTGWGVLAVLAGAAAAQTSQPALPPGHPTLEQMQAMRAQIDAQQGGGASTQPATPAADAKGALHLRVVQGTPGGPALGSTTVTVALYHRGAVLKTFDVQLDHTGTAQLTDLPVVPAVQPMLSIEHVGVLQQGLGPVLDAQHPDQKIEMKVYEVTTTRPAWKMAMRHVIVSDSGAQVHVTEMVAAESPADGIWRGEPMGDKTVTIALPLPAGAHDVSLDGGFDADLTQVASGMLITASPLFPGRTEFRFSYTLSAEQGKVALPIATPVPVDTMMVFLPADQTTVSAKGIEGGDVMSMGANSVRVYRGQNLPAGARAQIEISGLAAAPTGAAAAVSESPLSPKNLALAGGAIVVLAGAGLLLRKPKKA